MAKKFSMGALIAVGAAAAAIGGGVAAYLNRETLKQVVNDISEKIAANKEEEDLFLEFEEEPVIHATDKAAEESDFVDAEGEAEVEEVAEVPAEEPEAPAAEEAVEA
ncbi:MAG: hypothetical protein IKK50_04715 [Ruminiclostridium sp.]|nr:hypothetical protein [Ruminiclostridium sp.]